MIMYISFATYFAILILICYLSYKPKNTPTDYLLGDRDTPYWVTAISAHASDMSSWLFMGLPATIFLYGGTSYWTAIGLAFFMFLNWHFVAPRLRAYTEKNNTVTLPSFFELHLRDKSGILRILSAVLSLFFFSFYISSGIIGMGYLFESIFQIDYTLGISIAVTLITIYTLVGGYTTIEWTDFFQGLFLLCIIIGVPILAYSQLAPEVSIYAIAKFKEISLAPLSDYSLHTIIQSLLIAVAWGLGYFGQPHILSKFMGVREAHKIHLSKYIGMTWHVLALFSACFVGFVGIALFPDGLENPELIFVEIVQKTLHPAFAGFILCAIFSATVSTIDSQILVLSSVIQEDIYKRWIKKNASDKERINISRLCVFIICTIAYMIALQKNHTVYALVKYAWGGLGASFGPMVLLTLYSKSLNTKGAVIGMILGSTTAAFWPWPELYGFDIAGIIPGFAIGWASAYCTSKLTRKK